MHRISARICGLFSLLAIALAAAPAAAQADCQERKPGEHCYTFDDDLLSSDVAFPGAARITGHGPPKRVLLIRLRTNFVPELYKSVEHI